MDEPDALTMLEELRTDKVRRLRSILFVQNGIGFVFHDTAKNVIPPARFYATVVDGARGEWRKMMKKRRAR